MELLLSYRQATPVQIQSIMKIIALTANFFSCLSCFSWLNFLCMREIVEFVFPNRLHRLAYFLRGIMIGLITSYLCTYSSTDDFQHWWILVVILSVYELFFIVLPRIRDIEMSGWWLVAIIVPPVSDVLGIILLFRRPVLLSTSRSTTTNPPSYP